MTIRGLANGLTRMVNGNQMLTWVQNSGYYTDNAGKRVPKPPLEQTLSGQVQPLTSDDIKHMDALNMQGVFRSVYLYGDVQAIVRADGKGGDLLRFPDAPGGDSRNWLVSKVMEAWPTWCRVIVTLQAQ